MWPTLLEFDTPMGAIQGNNVVHAASGTLVHEFIGIPFAKPVISDNLRFLGFIQTTPLYLSYFYYTKVKEL